VLVGVIVLVGVCVLVGVLVGVKVGVGVGVLVITKLQLTISNFSQSCEISLIPTAGAVLN